MIDRPLGIYYDLQVILRVKPGKLKFQFDAYLEII